MADWLRFTLCVEGEDLDGDVFADVLPRRGDEFMHDDKPCVVVGCRWERRSKDLVIPRVLLRHPYHPLRQPRVGDSYIAPL